MKTPETFAFPNPQQEYDYFNESQHRREVALSMTELRADVIDTRNTSEKEASLALRRHQFLTMGG